MVSPRAAKYDYCDESPHTPVMAEKPEFGYARALDSKVTMNCPPGKSVKQRRDPMGWPQFYSTTVNVMCQAVDGKMGKWVPDMSAGDNGEGVCCTTSAFQHLHPFLYSLSILLFTA